MVIRSVDVMQEPEMYTEGPREYVQIVFDDDHVVNLDEEELRNAAALAEKGCLHD
jgi:hypothetical protein